MLVWMGNKQECTNCVGVVGSRLFIPRDKYMYSLSEVCLLYAFEAFPCSIIFGKPQSFHYEENKSC